MSLFTILETIFIGPLKLIFEFIYYFAFKVLGHPGLAIIALSLAMNILVLPLYRRADAMQEAARDVENKLSRGVSHIKKVFSGDERMMILQTYYRQNHYKPTDALKGSVSLLLEVPFFMAAYQFLSSVSVLESSSFGPIADLSLPDGLIVIGGIAINALPIAMTLINVISSAMYLKGFPLKTKIQLYAMAAFFLVFLYNSPSGLVFYWTLNNLFSLCKTIFYKLKNPKRVAMTLLLLVGAGILSYGLFFYHTPSTKRKLFVLIVGAAAMLLPVALALLSKLPAPKVAPKTNRKLFVLGGVFLTLLIGFLIPSAVISASPQEFVDPADFYNPLFYVLHAGCMAAGTFLVWLQVFYWLANDTGKVIFEKILWVLCGAMLVTYMFFGTKLGILSPSLQYETGLIFSGTEKLLNLAAWAGLAVVLLLVLRKWPKPALTILLTASIAVGGMSAVNMASANKAVQRFAGGDTSYVKDDSYFTLSQTEKNVVVIMLDRAMGQTVPYIFQEKPELKEQFDGFTYYDNTISYGLYTNFGSPALFGGYEYTPVEMNKRSDKSLGTKHNEAITLMPTLFSQNGYDVTVCDPVYANYEWISDLSIYQDMPGVNAYNTQGAFSQMQQDRDSQIRSTSRNFFCFSLMKTLPLPLQTVVYGYGNYNQLDNQTVQTATNLSVAEGLFDLFLDCYYVLNQLPQMTGISSDGNGAFLCMVNNMTHEPCLLQAPDYTPAKYVDNTAYDAANASRFTVDGQSLTVINCEQMRHYHANMAAFIQLGNWFDYLRENGVYDNTRIILAADHGAALYLQEELIMNSNDIGKLFPLLMVKDFDAEGFTTSSEFMTNADVPTLAMDGVIEDPVNPFTGKSITNTEKTAHDQFIILSDEWEVTVNNGNTFLPAKWASITNNIWDPADWEFYDEETVLAEHSAP